MKKQFIAFASIFLWIIFLFLRAEVLVPSIVTVNVLRLVLVVFTFYAIKFHLLKKSIVLFFIIAYLLASSTLFFNGSFLVSARVVLHHTIFTFIWAAVLFSCIVWRTQKKTKFILAAILFVFVAANYFFLFAHINRLGSDPYSPLTYLNLEYRFNGLGNNENLTSLLIVFSIAFLRFILPSSKGRLFALLIFSFPLIFATGSKAGIIAASGLTVIFNNLKKTVMLFAVLCAILALNFEQIEDSFIYSRFSALVTLSGRSTTLRASFIDNALNDLEIGGKFAGFGPNAFQETYRFYSHNNFIEMLYSYGFVVFVVFCLLLTLICLGLFAKGSYYYIGVLAVYNVISLSYVSYDPIMMLIVIYPLRSLFLKNVLES